ncbi:MAG: mechanosensitive ion channel [Deltaproteobacteria bacterium]|jgi:small-conductance mechanosensitive channel|nr:mechanosensitive ion channel [Deltaproteobacteria bacterium]
MRSRIGKLFTAAALIFLGAAVWLSGPAAFGQTAPPADSPAAAAQPAAPPEPAAPEPEPLPNPDETLGTTAEDDQILRQIWQERIQTLSQQASELAVNIDTALEGGDFSRRLTQANGERNRLMRLFQISRGYPAQQEDLLRQMQGLADQIARERQPLELLQSTLSQKQAEVQSLQKDLAGATLPAGPEETSPQTSLESLFKLLEASGHKLSSVLEPGQSLLAYLQRTIADIEKELPVTWQDYYLKSLSETGQGFGLTSNYDLIVKWLQSVTSMSLFIYPQTGADWLAALVKFLITMGITAILGTVVKRSTARLSRSWQDALDRILKGPWLWLIFGFALLMAARSPLGGSYLLLKLPGVLMLLWGLAALSWQMRLAAVPKLIGQKSPLSRFFPPAALGVFFLYLDCPAGPMTVVWAAVLVIFLIWLRRSGRKELTAERTILEGLAFGSSFYFALVSLLVAVIGYPRLAILVFLLLFTLVNIMVLASALIALGSMLSDSYFNPEVKPIRHAIIQSLAIPLAFILSLVCAGPWLWAVPGSEYLLRHLMQTGYTVGDASFEVSRIIFIAVLFFLFRSLLAFGRTSLEQLPRTFPGLEKGVIPPLQALFTYLVWGLFAIIALALLGVNFTSLAVVAGGLSVGIGMGLQNLFNNLVSGLILMFGRTITVGDLVEVGGVTGTVKSITIRSTTLETAEKAVVFVPNSSIMSGQFVNWTRNHRQVRRNLTIGTCYGIDIARALTLMKEAALANDKVLAGDPPLAVLSSFGDSSLVFTLYVTITDIDLAVSVLSALRMDVEQRFNAAGITIFNPSLEVTLTGSPAPALPPAEPAGPDFLKA